MCVCVYVCVYVCVACVVCVVCVVCGDLLSLFLFCSLLTACCLAMQGAVVYRTGLIARDFDPVLHEKVKSLTCRLHVV